MAQAPPDPARQASITIASSEPGADIEVNGGFVGNTPTVLKLEPGQYAVTVRSRAKVWQRTLQVNAGSTVTLNAVFESAPLAQRRP